MKGLLFVYTLTYGGAVLALFRPFYGVLIYLCFACLRPESLWHWSVPAGNYSRTVAIATLVGWAIAGFGDWNLGAARSVLTTLLCYWSWIVVSAAFATHQDVAWSYVVLHSKIILPVIVGMTLVRDVQQLKLVARVIVGCLGFLALQGNLDYFAGGHQVRIYGFAQMDNNCFCIAMVAGAGVAFFLGLAETNLFLKGSAFGAALLMAHVPMFGNSRGGMLGLIAGGAMAFVLLPKKPAMLAVWFCGVLLCIRLAGPAVVERFSSTFASQEERDESAQSRIDIWMDCWDVMKKYPLTGAGPDHWPILAPNYGWPAGKEAHSLWFNAGAELGFPGVLLLLSFYALAMRTSWRLATATDLPDPWLRDAGRMCVTGLTAFLVSASFVALDALEVPYYIAVLGAGAMAIASRGDALKPVEQAPPALGATAAPVVAGA